MIIGKKFFITEMPKTGTTFLRNYFAQYKNIELTIFPEGRHEMLNETNKEEVYQFVFDWLEKKCTK